MTNNAPLDKNPKLEQSKFKQILITFAISICIYISLLIPFINEGTYRYGFFGIYLFITAFILWYFLLILPACFSVLFLYRRSVATTDNALPIKERNVKIVKKIFSAITKVNFVLFLITAFYIIFFFGIDGIRYFSSLGTATPDYSWFYWRFDLLVAFWLSIIFGFFNTISLLVKKQYWTVGLSCIILLSFQKYIFISFFGLGSTETGFTSLTSQIIFTSVFVVLTALQLWYYVKLRFFKS